MSSPQLYIKIILYHLLDCLKGESVNRSVMSDSLQPHGLQHSRLFCPWNSPGKSTGVGSRSLPVIVRLDPGAMTGRPSSLPLARRSLTEGSSQIPETNDSTLRRLKLPHPSHIERPVSPRRLGLATYPNPRPSSLTIPRIECIKTTPNKVRARTSSTCLVRVQEPCPGALHH